MLDALRQTAPYTAGVLSGTERWAVAEGDCLDFLRRLPDACVDSMVTDPPAAIGFMNRTWDHNRGGREAWIEWLEERMYECWRVLKPGGYTLTWAFPRTSHWTATAIENADFYIDTVITHLFGQAAANAGNLGKRIDKKLGREREVLGPNPTWREAKRNNTIYGTVNGGSAEVLTAPASDEARQWEGWSTQLKPASEHWILAHKPHDGSIVNSVLQHGVGALNIDGCRIPGTPELPGTTPATANGNGKTRGHMTRTPYTPSPGGRWPANLLLTHSPGCVRVGEAQIRGDRRKGGQGSRPSGFGNVGAAKGSDQPNGPLYGDQTVPVWDCVEDCPIGELERQKPGASRYFTTFKYEPKASKRDRGEANDHPTVKSTALMAWLCKLVTPPGGIVLDPFCGSGSTGVAALREGFRFLGVDEHGPYVDIAIERMESEPQ